MAGMVVSAAPLTARARSSAVQGIVRGAYHCPWTSGPNGPHLALIETRVVRRHGSTPGKGPGCAGRGGSLFYDPTRRNRALRRATQILQRGPQEDVGIPQQSLTQSGAAHRVTPKIHNSRGLVGLRLRRRVPGTAQSRWSAAPTKLDMRDPIP